MLGFLKTKISSETHEKEKLKMLCDSKTSFETKIDAGLGQQHILRAAEVMGQWDSFCIGWYYWPQMIDWFILHDPNKAFLTIISHFWLQSSAKDQGITRVVAGIVLYCFLHFLFKIFLSRINFIASKIQTRVLLHHSPVLCNNLRHLGRYLTNLTSENLYTLQTSDHPWPCSAVERSVNQGWRSMGRATFKVLGLIPLLIESRKRHLKQLSSTAPKRDTTVSKFTGETVSPSPWIFSLARGSD